MSTDVPAYALFALGFNLGMFSLSFCSGGFFWGGHLCNYSFRTQIR